MQYAELVSTFVAMRVDHRVLTCPAPQSFYRAARLGRPSLRQHPHRLNFNLSISIVHPKADRLASAHLVSALRLLRPPSSRLHHSHLQP